MDTVQKVIADARALGIRLHLKNGELTGTPGSLVTPELRARVVALKPEIIRHLRAGPPPIPNTPPVHPMPFERKRQEAKARALRHVVTPAERELAQAWEEAFGRARVSFKEAFQAAERLPELREALVAVAPGAAGIDERRLLQFLMSLNNVSIDGVRLVLGVEPRNGPQWCLAVVPAPEVKP